MTSEVFTIHATSYSGAVSLTTTSCACTGAVDSGMMYLYSDLWSGRISTLIASNVFRIPKGCALKIWESKVYSPGGEAIPASVSVLSSAVSGNVATSYNVVVSDSIHCISGLTSQNPVSVNDYGGRPIVIPSYDGHKAIKFQYETSVGSTGVCADYVCEIVELNF